MKRLVGGSVLSGARRPRVAFVTPIVVVFVLVTAQAALADNTWTGGASNGTPGSTSTWSTGGNWSSGTGLTAGPEGTLTFPTIASCNSSSLPCDPYYSVNDVTGAIVSGIVIDDKSNYTVSGNAITLGSGGITTTTDGPGAGSAPKWSVPITLDANQTWSIDGANNAGRVILQSPVTGPVNTLGVSLANAALLNLSGDNEVGAFTATGDGNSGNAVIFAQSGGSLNATDDQPVTMTNATLVAFANLSTGPLTIGSSGNGFGGMLQLQGGAATPVLSVNGAADLSTSQDTLISIAPSAAAPAAGTNYAQLTASGDVTLGGALSPFVATSNGACSALTLGNVYTLVQTTGTGTTLSGTFSNAPDGAVLTLGCNSGTPPAVEIHYTSTSVTATVVDPTATTLQASPTSATTNETVTLTANVSNSSGGSTPTGTVEFTNAGSAIPGCSAQPLDGSGNATCQTSFAASSSPESLSATYTPTNGAHFGDSATTSPTSLTVSPDSTATGVSVSNGAPQTGQDVTYTATVTPADAGPVTPSGGVEFDDNGTPIPSCSSQSLTPGASSSSATCTVSYPSTGSHSIIATYAGDTNFDGSDSSANPQSVTVVSPSPSNPSPPPSSGTPQALSINDSGPSSMSGSTVDPGIEILCPAGGAPCTASEQATVEIGAPNTPVNTGRRRAHPVTVGSAQFTIPAGTSLEATFPLNQLGKTLISDHKHVTLQVAASGQVQGGATTAVGKTVVLNGQLARYQVRAIQVHRGGTVTVRVKVSAPGQVNVLVTAWKSSLASAARVLNPALGRFVVARDSTTAKHAGVLTIQLRPNATGQQALTHATPRFTVRLWVSYIPLYAFQTDTGYFGLHPGSSCSLCRGVTS